LRWGEVCRRKGRRGGQKVARAVDDVASVVIVGRGGQKVARAVDDVASVVIVGRGGQKVASAGFHPQVGCVVEVLEF